jgi:hypothetical protein
MTEPTPIPLLEDEERVARADLARFDARRYAPSPQAPMRMQQRRETLKRRWALAAARLQRARADQRRG